MSHEWNLTFSMSESKYCNQLSRENTQLSSRPLLIVCFTFFLFFWMRGVYYRYTEHFMPMMARCNLIDDVSERNFVRWFGKRKKKERGGFLQRLIVTVCEEKLAGCKSYEGETDTHLSSFGWEMSREHKRARHTMMTLLSHRRHIKLITYK